MIIPGLLAATARWFKQNMPVRRSLFDRQAYSLDNSRRLNRELDLANERLVAHVHHLQARIEEFYPDLRITQHYKAEVSSDILTRYYWLELLPMKHRIEWATNYDLKEEDVYPLARKITTRFSKLLEEHLVTMFTRQFS